MTNKPVGCQEAIKHLLSFLDDDLSPAKKREVEQHLLVCRTCFSRAEFEKHLKEQLRETGEEPAPPALHKRIKHILGRF